jgi:valyl-tRNA synthetase
MAEFPKKYDFNEAESKWQEFWQQKAVYHWDKNVSRDKTFVVDTPPPTVSGLLHIGHVYSYTHTDFIVRYKRMKGMNIFYPIGFDDNGLPTERLVEKKKNIRANSMKREEFVEICRDVIESEEVNFRQLFNQIGLSVDWNVEYRTISDTSQKLSQMSFLDLIKKEQIYRSSQPMLWDPVDQTALSQADIEDKERTSFMNNIKFKIDGEDTELIIATTRPELIPACVAVFYHPDDKRYIHLKGKHAITPLFGNKVPIIADELVDQEKGTGLVMCCTFGDQTDVLWWRKHNLPCKIIIGKIGIMQDIMFDQSSIDLNKAERFAAEITGLKVNAARQKMIELLDSEALLVSKTEITQVVKCAERSGAPLEILTTPQWFVKTIEHKDELMKRIQQINWHPLSMKIKLENWINSIALDWCISRQRYFGVPFPVWYSKRAGEQGKPIFADIDQLPVDPLQHLPKGYSRNEVEPDLDVMDTWSTSSISPQLNSHGINDNFMLSEERHNSLFPADLRPQAHEILRTWAFYTILKSYLHDDKLPWENIMISGWCLAEDRSKMSKSKGNVLVPSKILEQFGADVVRYWSASSRLGGDTAYSEDVMKNGKRLVNKLWNAAKFSSTHFNKITDADKKLNLSQLKSKITCDFDRYFINKLCELVELCTAEFERYEYSSAMSKLEQFFWSLFCDNYLEITKTRAYGEDQASKQDTLSAVLTIYHSFKIILQLFAPFMPYVTEELYQTLYDDANSLHKTGNWPSLKDTKLSDVNTQGAENLIKILDLVRKIKAQQNLSIKAPINVIEVKGRNLSPDLIKDLINVTSAREVKFVEKLSSDEQNLIIDDVSINVIM